MSSASRAVIIGLRVKASAMAVPILTRLVAVARAAAVTVALRFGNPDDLGARGLRSASHLHQLPEGLTPGGVIPGTAPGHR